MSIFLNHKESNVQVSISLREGQLKNIEKLAKMHKMKKSAVIRILLDYALEKNHEKES